MRRFYRAHLAGPFSGPILPGPITGASLASLASPRYGRQISLRQSAPFDCLAAAFFSPAGFSRPWGRGAEVMRGVPGGASGAAPSPATTKGAQFAG